MGLEWGGTHSGRVRNGSLIGLTVVKGKKKWYLASIFFATRFIVMSKLRYFDENSDRPNRREHDGFIREIVPD